MEQNETVATSSYQNPTSLHTVAHSQYPCKYVLTLTYPWKEPKVHDPTQENNTLCSKVEHVASQTQNMISHRLPCVSVQCVQVVLCSEVPVC
eukprot:3224357-Amphidinium_carterae.1